MAVTDDKRYSSHIEDDRLSVEEQPTWGQHILPQQIWRDAGLIPGSPSMLEFSTPEVENGAIVSYSYFKDGQAFHGLVEKIIKLPLTRIPGTKNGLYHKDLCGIIGSEFDSDHDDVSKSWRWTLYLNDEELPYGRGEPIIDTIAGNLILRNEEFVSSLEDSDTFTISFYRYIGRTGFVGSDNNEQDLYGGFDLPIRDDLKHFKDADNDSTTASFMLAGTENNHTIYILPKSGETYIDYNLEKDELAQTTAINNLQGVVMLQENYNEIDWNIGVHNGGVWHTDGTVTKN